jgi:hypothetical protein
MCAYLAEDLQSVDLWHIQVQESDLGHDAQITADVPARTKQKIQRLRPIAGDDDLVLDMVLPQCSKGEGLIIGIVFDK